MTDTTRDLIQRMAKELDLYRQMARDDCTSTHPFADEARAYLSQPEPEWPTDSELVAVLHQAIKDFPPNHPDAKALGSLEYDIEIELRKARAVLARWGRATVEPEPEGLTDEEILKISDQFDIDGIEDVTKGMPLDTFWDSYQPQQLISFARAIIAADRARCGRPTTATETP